MELTAIQCLQKSKHILDDVTDRLLTKGYYMPPSYTEWGMSWQDIIIPEVTLRKFARRVAKEAKRPFVQVYRYYEYQRTATGIDFDYKNPVEVGIRIEMPKRRYLAPLVNPIILAGFPSMHYSSVWGFRIKDKEFAQQYLEYFATREEFRKALRLPT